VLAEEVEPILNACHVSFVRRKFQSPLTQELFYQRADFVDQQIIAVAGDDKVSSPGEFRPEALSELYMNLSAHTAPTREPRRTPICQ
jgi:hypothetical protein